MAVASRFVADREKRKVSGLRTEDLTGAVVLAFLHHVERDRRASMGTRNCRLAAIRSFLLVRRAARAAGREIVLGGIVGPFQAGAEEVRFLPGVR